MVLSSFDIQVTLILSTKFPVKWPFGSEENKHKIDFQDGSHFGFPIGMTLASFDLQVATILPKFGVS